jgi:uncharacterized protein (TIGR03083 family)
MAYWFLDTLAVVHSPAPPLVIEMTIPPGGSPPLHVHHDLDDSSYLLDGTLAVRFGERTFRADPGTYLPQPAGVPHTFRVLGSRAARMLVVHADDRRALEATGRIVANVAPGQWTAPTPCAAWDVHALVNHLVAGNLWAAELAGGRTVEEVGDRLDGDLLGTDPRRAYDASAAAANAAFAAPGALEAPCAVSEVAAPQADVLRASGVFGERIEPPDPAMLRRACSQCSANAPEAAPQRKHRDAIHRRYRRSVLPGI